MAVWRCNFDTQSDIDNGKFRKISVFGSGGYLTVSNSELHMGTNTIDRYLVPVLDTSSLGVSDITRLSFSCRFTGLSNSGAFPSIALTYESGKRLVIFLYNNFSWSGYSEVVYKTLYSNRGKAFFYSEPDGKYQVMWNNVSNYHNINYHYDVLKDPSTGTVTIRTTTGLTSNFTPTYGKEKIKSIALSLNYFWYNSNKKAILDWVEVEYSEASSININGVWKQGSPFVNINGVWKQGSPFVNINGVWKQTN